MAIDIEKVFRGPQNFINVECPSKRGRHLF
jgi:hypothetical protein